MAETRSTSGLAIGAVASASAAVLHAAAAGIHADHPGLARIFIALAVAQLAVAVLAIARSDRLACAPLFAVNAAAVGGWLVTRLVGISWVGGLEVAERPQVADTVGALLAGVALVAAASCAFGRSVAVSGRALSSSVVLAGVLLVPGLADATTHDHADADHGHADPAATDDHGHVEPASGAPGDPASVAHPTDVHAADAHATDDHPEEHPADDHATDDHATPDHASDDHASDDHLTAEPLDDTAQWPRPWDPREPIDFSGVEGVSAEQQARAEQLVRDTIRDLPAFADVAKLPELGYRSIGDASTGFEHYIDLALFDDGKELDPTAPESLVYRVDGAERELVSAMFIVARTDVDDPRLTEYAGPLMQWHVHDNLCWGLGDDGQPVVKGVLAEPGDTCPAGSVNAGGDNPMVHVWITPHACGPFAALEGHGAGQAGVGDGARTDLCTHGHDDAGDGHGESPTAMPYDPALPIDLSGNPSVTPEQQAFAENLVAVTLRYLPQWADLAAVEAAGFHSIGDAGTGHEHFIQWDWIDDDVWLDPNRPESLVFEPQPDGSTRLVSAMYMLPSGTALDEVPDWGGPLMQWHVHGDLCFTDDPEAPQVAGIKPIGTPCRPPLVDGTLAPMIHVWIRPHECGPFAALDGVGGGQVPAGEAVLCDEAHGAH
jgi:hypothetical protein